jgi:hypothetical protein
MVMVSNRRLPSQLVVAAVLILVLALALFGALWRPAPAAGQSLTPAGAAVVSLSPHPYCVATMTGC